VNTVRKSRKICPSCAKKIKMNLGNGVSTARKPRKLHKHCEENERGQNRPLDSYLSLGVSADIIERYVI
jgi:hypothetical protein